MKEIQETPTDSLLSYANLPEHCQFPTNVVCEFFALPHLEIGDCMITMLSVHHCIFNRAAYQKFMYEVGGIV